MTAEGGPVPPDQRPLDIVIADDAPLFRGLLAQLLSRIGSVRETADPAAMFDAVARRPPDVVVLDVRMPPTFTVEGLDAALRIRNRYPEVGVLLLSNDVQLLYLDRVLRTGSAGAGYLLKERVSGIDEFIASVRSVASGGQAIDPEVVAALMAKRSTSDRLAGLTDREREVLSLMAQGLSNAAIAERLIVVPKTVEAAIHRILSVLELAYDGGHNRRVLAVLAFLGGGAPTAVSR